MGVFWALLTKILAYLEHGRKEGIFSRLPIMVVAEKIKYHSSSDKLRAFC